jgi:hypothetical protein
MGKRARKRSGGLGKSDPTHHPDRSTEPGIEAPPPVTTPTSVYTDAAENELELRGSLTLKARAEYTATLAGGLDREDAWQRATELLFERLTVSWTVSGVRTDRQKELLGRYRMATADERRFIRDSLREHVSENFPELEAP